MAEDCAVESDEGTRYVKDTNFKTEIGALKSEVRILLSEIDSLKLQIPTLSPDNNSVETGLKVTVNSSSTQRQEVYNSPHL